LNRIDAMKELLLSSLGHSESERNPSVAPR
jgi:hypothetical protein